MTHPISPEHLLQTALSSAQQQLWFLQCLAPQSPFYHIPAALRLRGQLDLNVLELALNEVIALQESLRTAFHTELGVPVRQVVPELRLTIPMTDLSGVPKSEQEATLNAALREEAQQLFDLSQAPLLRVRLYRLSPSHHLLQLTSHHLVMDGWSVGIFTHMLLNAYERELSGTTPIQQTIAPYAEFVRWQQEQAGTPDRVAEDIRYWQAQLRDAPTKLRLPFDKVRSHPPTYHGKTETFMLPSGLPARLSEIAHRFGATLFSSLLAAFHLTLARMTGQQDLVIASAVSNRTLAQFESMIGCCANTLPLRARIESDSCFRELLEAVSESVVGALDHQTLPFEKLIGALALERDPIVPPFTQVMFLFEPGGKKHWDLPYLTVTPVPVFCDSAKFALGLYVQEVEGTYQASLEYSTELFAAQTIQDLIHNFIDTLTRVVEAPELPFNHLFSGKTIPEAATLPEPQTTLHERIFRQALVSPQSSALAWQGGEMSYRELLQRANDMTRKLQQAGVAAGDRVGIAMRKSPQAIVAILGVLASGAAYVPLDTRQPKKRLQQMIVQADLSLVLDERHAFHQFDAAAFQPFEVAACDSGSLAYIMFTSGTAGVPKGVMVRHESLVHLADALHDTVYREFVSRDGCKQKLRIGLNGPLHFDTSVKQLLQLAFGHCLYLLPEAERGFEPAAICHALESGQVDVFDCTPSQMALLMQQGLGRKELIGPTMALLGGEAIPLRFWQQLAALETMTVWNLYGPTECTVDVTAARVTGEKVTIGTPLPGMSIIILDERQRPVIDGMIGEICVSGRGVASGYIGDPQLTAERFIHCCGDDDEDEYSLGSDDMCYLTGDLGRLMSDGQIEYLGRCDSQLKVRGVRIEATDVETVLSEHPAIHAAIAWQPPVTEDSVTSPFIAGIVAERMQSPLVGGLVRQALPNGLAVVGFNPNETDFLYHEVFVNNAYFRHGIRIDDGACVIDVGANIGLFGVAVSCLADRVKLYSLEPNPYLTEVLRTNLSLYAPDADVQVLGAGEVAGRYPFTFYPHLSFLSGLYADPAQEKSLVRSYLERHHAAALEGLRENRESAIELLLERELTARQLEVEIQPLSQLIDQAGLSRIDLLKINAEKSEEAVLAGIRSEHWARLAQIVMEVHDQDGRLDRLVRRLQEQGFDVTVDEDWSVDRKEGIYYLYARRPSEDGKSRPSPDVGSIQGEGVLTRQTVQEHLQKYFPEHLLPNRIIFLEQLPMTSRGKLDRRAVMPESVDESVMAADDMTLTETEQRVIALWQSVIPGAPLIGRHSRFFDVGGDSLLLAQVYMRLHELGEYHLTLTELFEYGTPAALASRLACDDQSAAQATGQQSQQHVEVNEPIAIVGMAGRFPGAKDIHALWKKLCDGEVTVSWFSAQELTQAGVSEAMQQDPAFVPVGGVLADIDCFDAGFFGFSPREADIMDPQQRLFMETVWHALEDAGCICETRTGVFAGSGVSTYLLNNIWQNKELVEQIGAHRLLIANDKDHIVTQTSYRLGLRGPSLAVQTSCSSSLVAVHMACRSLHQGECDVAVAGGVSVRVPQRTGYRYQQGSIGSCDGVCAPFDVSANGTVSGNGVAVVTLKRFSDAQKAGDRIMAVIKGSAINNDGNQKIGYTAPSVEGQSEVINAALLAAQVKPADIGYVEAHGTGTLLGDPIEIESLKRAFRCQDESASVRHCAVGSIKGTLGHLDSAAGVAGLIKATLMVQKGMFVPSANFSQPNPNIDFSVTPFTVCTETGPWQEADGPRRAGVSSFGIGGTNAHVVLEQAPLPLEETQRATMPYAALLVWSAHHEQALEQWTQMLSSVLDESEDLCDIAYSLQTGRRSMMYRRTLVATNLADAADALRNGRFQTTVCNAGESGHDAAEISHLIAAFHDSQADDNPEIQQQNILENLATIWREGGR
ncbi:non-ribosomal peptide synthetase [Vibrio spartinae]|uniref:Beta-ketoacyl-acyl-carrier-protein synthase I n=1 Tax=Vibrio spartinae TaxID=1918945 RepID=A0ABX6QY22_9VIBR|nr:non-ribosomal peptide synthetase [Vibrio spartinae]QMV14113.1 Beta-ketoacyl-acyl-carrier-protein synthase I [Vibrio spartinae]